MNASEPIHSTQNSCFGAFRTVLQLHESQYKTGRTCAIKCTNSLIEVAFSQRTHLSQSTRPKTHVLGHFEPFRYSMKVDAKLAEQVPLTHKSAKRICVEIFHNERTRSTPLDPKLMFWDVSDYFVCARNSLQSWPNMCH
jgi:hypothetical protein